MKSLKYISLLCALILCSQLSFASYANISNQICNEIISKLPSHEREVRLPIYPTFPLVGEYNKYEFTYKSCSIDSQTLTDKNHDILIKINGRGVEGNTVGIDAKVSCLFTSDYEWACLYSKITHNINMELHYIQFGHQWTRQVPSQQSILDIALAATNQYL